MAGDRQIRINLDGKETVSPAAKKAGKALEDLGDDADSAARRAKRLDDEIEDLGQELHQLAAAYAAAGSAEERADLGKSMRKLQGQSRQLGNVRKIMQSAGEDGAAGFSVGFIGRLGPLVAKAPVSGPLVGAFAAAAPAVASVVGGAVTAGVGLAAVGAGLAIAFKDPGVKAAAADLGDDVGQMLTRAAKPFVPATTKAIAIVKKEFRTIEPELDRIFGASAPWVPRLAQAGARGASEFSRGFADAVENAGPGIEVLEYHIPRAAAVAGDALATLTKNAEFNADALSASLATVEFSIAHAANATNFLSEVFKYSIGGAVVDATNGFRGTADAADAAGDAAGEAVPPVSAVGAEFARLGRSADDAKSALLSYLDANRQIADQNLSAAEATLRYKDAVNEAKDAVDKKRKVSQEEDLALIGLARSSNTLIESLDRQGASTSVLSARHKQARNDLIAAAQAAGYTETQAEALADSYLAIPRDVKTNVVADTEQAARNLRMVRDLIAAIKSKRVVITTVNNQVVTRSEGRNVGIGDGIGGREHGGPVKKGHAYVVGEKRAEVFVPDRDGRIVPSIEKYDRMTGRVTRSAGGSAMDSTANIEVAMTNALRRVLREMPVVRFSDAGRQADVWRRTQ